MKKCTLIAPVLPVKPIWLPVFISHCSALVSLDKRGDTHVLYILTKRGFVRDKMGLRQQLRAFRLQFS